MCTCCTFEYECGLEYLSTVPVDTSNLTLPVLGYIPVPTELEGCLLHAEMSQPPARKREREQNSHGSQSQSQSRDYKQNLLVRSGTVQPTMCPCFFSLSKKGQPNPAARTLRIKVGLYGHPSQNFKINTYLTPRHEMPKVRYCSLLGIFCKVTRYMMCFFLLLS